MNRAVFLFAAFVPNAGISQTANTPVQTSQSKPADEFVDGFFNKLKAGQTEMAVSNVFDRSELTAGRTADKQLLISQIENAVKLYGPIRKAELVSSDPVGSLYLKRYYIAQHDKMLTRWEFDLILTPKGWMAGYFGFDDQVKTWK